LKLRHKVLGLLGILSVLTFLDRMAIAVAAPGIQSELRISPQMWGWVLSAYVLANGIFEIPSGWIGDRFGQRGELTRLVAWWSSFTALTAACFGFWQLLVARFLFGLGAAGAYPNSAGVIARWFPASERARSQGTVWAASRLGGALASLLILPLQMVFGWRAVFCLLGLLGFLWAVVWCTWFRNRPTEHPAITAQEIAEIGSHDAYHVAADWNKLLHNAALWRVVIAYGCYGCGSWFYFSWFPLWMVHHVGLTLDGAIFAALPFLVGLCANLLGGFLGDRLSARWSAGLVLRLIPCICLLLAAVELAAMALCHSRLAIVALSSLGFGTMDLMLPSMWALCLAIGGRFSGTATGMMNTAGQAGGFLCTVLFGYIVQHTGSYDLPLWFIAGMVLLSALLISGANSARGVDTEREEQPLPQQV
jgi:MFS transporter, ACS family, glucarate transporter